MRTTVAAQTQQKCRWLPKIRRREWQGVVYISPWLLGFLVFTAYPFLWSIQLSLMSWKGSDMAKFVGFDNYAHVFTNEAFLYSIRITLAYTMVHVPSTMLLAFVVALLLNERVWFVALFRIMFYLPSVTSGAATGAVWLWILHPEGLLNQGLALFDVTGPDWFGSTIWALPGIILMSLWNIGSMVAIYLAGLQSVQQQLYDAAELDGANMLQRIHHVTLPMLTPMLFQTLLLGIISDLHVFTAVFVATEGGPGYATMFVLPHIYFNAFKYFNIGYASAVAWVIGLIIMLLTFILFSLARRWVYCERPCPG